MPQFPNIAGLDIEGLRATIASGQEEQVSNLGEFESKNQMPEDSDDFEIWPGGPLDSELRSWKKQFGGNGHGVFLSTFDGGKDRFIWRTMSRYEYKVIMSAQGTDPLLREEMICQTCILYPKNYSFEDMAPGKAGYPAVLATHIMRQSGFVDIQPTRL